MSIRRTATLCVVALSVSVSGALAGCSADAEPEAKPSETEATSAAPSITPAPQGETAEAFIQRWFDESEAMQATGQTAQFIAMSEQCAPCKNLAARVERIHAGGGSISFKGTSVRTVKRGAHNSRLSNYEVRTDSESTTWRESKSAPPQSLPGGEQFYKFTLAGGPGSWTVADYVRLAE